MTNLNSPYFKTTLRIILTLAAVSLTVYILVSPEKAMVIFFAQELGYPCLIYINAILWIYPLIILRKGLLNQIPKVNLLAFLIPCFIIILIWIFNSSGIISDGSALEGTVIVSVLPWEEVTIPAIRGIGNLLIGNKQLATVGGTNPVSILAGNKVIPSSLHMEESTINKSSTVNIGNIPTESTSTVVSKDSDTSNTNIEGMAAAVNLLAHLKSLNTYTEWCEKHRTHMQAFVQEVYDWCNESQKGCISKELADPLVKSADFLEDWDNKTSKARKVHDVAVAILKPAIDSNKGITESTYFSISKQGNNALQDLEKIGKEYQKKENVFEECKKAYLEAKENAIYTKVGKFLKEYWESKKD